MYSAKSSSGASKSGAIQWFVSLAVPGWHGSSLTLSGGDWLLLLPGPETRGVHGGHTGRVARLPGIASMNPPDPRATDPPGPPAARRDATPRGGVGVHGDHVQVFDCSTEQLSGRRLVPPGQTQPRHGRAARARRRRLPWYPPVGGHLPLRQPAVAWSRTPAWPAAASALRHGTITSRRG